MNNTQNNIWLWILKRFYGVEGVIDEYGMQFLNRLGNQAFIASWFYIVILTLVACVLMFTEVTFQAEWLVLANLIFTLGLSFYVTIQVRRSGLARIEVDHEDLATAKRRLKWSSVRMALVYGVMLVLMELVFVWFDPTEDPLIRLTNTSNIVRLVMMTIAFGVVIYWMRRSQVKTYDDEV